ncbi:MAG TPA: ABC transporter ATP-binding protein [Hyphomicrobiaceae bacterium]|nr:ABC transporter ATP-binding protein [Hyphomicrobiaceae bacterium]
MRLATQGICVRLGRRSVLHDVTVSAERGELVAVIGPNGAGKSTLLKSLAGLVPVCDGRVLLDGDDIVALDARARGRRIAFIAQDRQVHWPLAVRRVVALGRLPHEVSSRDEAAIANALSAMDLHQLADRPIYELSGGELARVLQARALAQEADILIADEPTAGLDMGHVLQLFAHLERLSQQGHTVIVAVHDISLALRHCHKTVLLKDGRVLAAGPSGDVVTPERLAAAFGVSVAVATLDHVPIVLAKQTLT